MHFTIEKIIKDSSSYFRSCISSNNNTDRKLQELFHAFVNLCIPFGDKFADARSIFVCLCIWVCLLLMHQEKKDSQTNPGHFKAFVCNKLNKSNHAHVLYWPCVREHHTSLLANFTTYLLSVLPPSCCYY